MYLVYSPDMVAAYALKTLRDENADEGTKDRFLREARIWIDLEQHPFITRAHFVDEIEDRIYIALEYIATNEGGLNNLEGYLKTKPSDLSQSVILQAPSRNHQRIPRNIPGTT